MTNKTNFGDIPLEFAAYENARVVLIPAPYEKTTSYGQGTGNGPDAILEASANMELFDETLFKEAYKIGIHTADALDFSNSTGEAAISKIEAAFEKVFKDKKFPLMLGGEHTVSTGGARAAAKFFKDLVVIQLDAHADLREDFHDTKWSHACVMKRIHDLGIKTIQVGIRSLSVEEGSLIKEKGLDIYWAESIHDNTKWIDEIISKTKGKQIYLTIDVDVFDPSIMASTGTPEPGGLSWYSVLTLVKRLMTERDVIGGDVVELAPVESNPSPDFTVSKLIYKIIGYLGSKA